MSTYAENLALTVVKMPHKSCEADGSVCTVDVNLGEGMRVCEDA